MWASAEFAKPRQTKKTKWLMKSSYFCTFPQHCSSSLILWIIADCARDLPEDPGSGDQRCRGVPVHRLQLRGQCPGFRPAPSQIKRYRNKTLPLKYLTCCPFKVCSPKLTNNPLASKLWNYVGHRKCSRPPVLVFRMSFRTKDKYSIG